MKPKMNFIESAINADVFKTTETLIRLQIATGMYNPTAICASVHEDLMQVEGEVSWIDNEIRFELQNFLDSKGLLNDDVYYVTHNIDWLYVSKQYHLAVHARCTRYAGYSPDTIRHFIQRHRQEDLDMSAMTGDSSTTVNLIEALLNKVEALEIDEFKLD